MQPEGLRESSRWSECSEDHRYRVVPMRTLKGCQTSLRGSRTPPGCCCYFHAFRWSTLRYDHRLLSVSPSGCTFQVSQLYEMPEEAVQDNCFLESISLTRSVRIELFQVAERNTA